MLKIETTRSTPTEITYQLCGELTAEGLPTLRGLLDDCARRRRAVTLDLAELTRADRECVELLVTGPGRRARIVHCPPYLREWRRAEQDRRARGKAGLVFLVVATLSARAAAADELTLSLSDAVARALSEGTAARIAGEQVVTASTQATQAKSALLPQLSGQVQGGNESINFATYGFPVAPGQSPVVGPFNVLIFQMSAAMNIIDIAAKKRWDAARQDVAVSEVEQRRTENDVAAAVATLYVSLQRAEASVETARANVELFTKLRDLADDQRRAGVATKVDSTRANVALARQQQSLIVAVNQRDAARLALLHAIGADQSTTLHLADRLRESEEAAPNVEQALAEARQDRPELQQLAAQALAEELTISAEKAERLPTFSAQLQGGYSGNRAADLFWSRQIVGLVSVPIYTGGRIGARVAEAESRRREIDLQAIEIGRQVEEEVRRSILAYESARERSRVAIDNERLAQEELDLSRDRFQNGVTSSIEVDNAQASLVTAQADRIAAAADQESARYDLWHATGQIRELIPGSHS
jgi:outer membrane protein